MATLWGHVNDPVPSLRARNPKLPEAVDGVLRKALAKEPGKRYPSCRALVLAARDALGVTGIEVPVAARGRRALFAAAAAVALVAAALLALFLTRGGGAPEPAAGGTLVRIDPASNEARQTFRVGDYPTAVSARDDGVWVAAFRDGSLWRVDPVSLAPTRIPSEGQPYDLVSYGGTVYVAAEGPEVSKGNVTAYDASNGHRIDDLQLLACTLTAGREGVWAAGCPNIDRLSRGEPLRILKEVPIPFQSPRDAQHDRLGMNEMVLRSGALWVLGDAGDRRIWRIDARDGRIVRTFRVPFPPHHLAVGEGAVWVTDQLGDVVARLDPASGRIVARIPAGRVASGVAVGAGSVWATSYLDGTVSRIDPGTNRVVKTIRVAGRPRDISVGGGAVWAVGDAS
jgi:YVTN family beta-propeller protein